MNGYANIKYQFLQIFNFGISLTSMYVLYHNIVLGDLCTNYSVTSVTKEWEVYIYASISMFIQNQL